MSLLVMAEGVYEAEGGEPCDGLTEEEFVERGFSDLVDEQATTGAADPEHVFAAHVGMTRLVDPRAIYREDLSMCRGTEPSVPSLLGKLEMPRWYLNGELSDPELDFQREMATIGVGWKVVPKTGHPMGLANPEGFAQTVADVLPASSWPR